MRITDVEGITVGHWTDPVGVTGCSVVLPPPGTVASGEVRGGAPGTRETDLLRPGMLVHEVHAILLTGGSAFGLAAADGVARWLEERGRGFEVGVARVPIVPAAVLFDLGVGDPEARPDPDAGYAACVAADRAVPEGSVGAGTGATVAKVHGPDRAVKGGIGSASTAGGGATVGAVVAVNAMGEVVDEDGSAIAAARPGPDAGPSPWPVNTTLAVVATDARLTRDQAHGLAGAGHDGIARAVRPAHTMWDGDTVFTLATGITDAPISLLGDLAQQAVAEAIRRAVRAARPLGGVPAAGERDR